MLSGMLDIPSRRELDLRITKAVISLELVSHTACSQPGSGHHQKPGSRPPTGELFPDHDEFSARYLHSLTDWDRLNAVVDAEQRLAHLRGVSAPRVEGGNDGWREYVLLLHQRDGMSGREIARREGVSYSYVCRIIRRGELRAA